ncbi:MAG: ribonuclease III [Candidatus Gastranaerophilales bacterium]|nr:ribonuclease III [Candidatus Gastranaerophilales bacterium]
MLSSARKKELTEFLEKLNITTQDLQIFDEALTHPSYNNEENIENAPDYERLEFLGDSVLRLAASNFLFDKFPDYDEGDLTKIRSWIVSDKYLSEIADKLGLPHYINIGKHEDKDGGRNKESIKACAMEAILGAMYKTYGYDFAQNFIIGIYNSDKIKYTDILYSSNSKEILQQYTQAKNKDLPQYKIIKESGSDHNKTYEACVIYNGKELGKGCSKTKKDAEKAAALEALKNLNLIGQDENE